MVTGVACVVEGAVVAGEVLAAEAAAPVSPVSLHIALYCVSLQHNHCHLSHKLAKLTLQKDFLLSMVAQVSQLQPSSEHRSETGDSPGA